VGPFDEEEEGTGVTSDVVKVEGGDPPTPGPLIQGMTPGPYRFPNIGLIKQSNIRCAYWKSVQCTCRGPLLVSTGLLPGAVQGPAVPPRRGEAHSSIVLTT